jgi:hypothetical protein
VAIRQWSKPFRADFGLTGSDIPERLCLFIAARHTLSYRWTRSPCAGYIQHGRRR